MPLISIDSFNHPLPFKGEPHNMVKYTQSIRRLFPTNCLSAFNHFVGLALKALTLQPLKLL